jgi:type I restriction enzyme S subunit
MADWKECNLGDVINLKRGYDLPSQNRRNGSVPIFSSSGITDFHDEAKATKPGVITGRYGTVGQVFYSEGDYFPLNTTLYVQDFKGNNPKFIYYLLKGFDFEKYSDKSAVPGVNRNDLHTEIIVIPPLPEQQAIAEVLSSLDDKIDLLHRQNKTLEAMAETLFRQWFVEEAEESWETTNLFNVVELVGGGTPKTDVAEYWDGEIKWISAKDTTPNHKKFIIDTEKKITEQGLNNSSARLLPKYATVISARGTVGNYCLLSETMAFSQSNYGIKPKFKDCFFFTYLLIANAVEELQSAAYGSVFDTITTNTFKEHSIKVPVEKEIQNFEEQLKPYFEKMLSNEIQIRTLTKSRDILLPKLMSGDEVRVKF